MEINLLRASIEQSSHDPPRTAESAGGGTVSIVKHRYIRALGAAFAKPL